MINTKKPLAVEGKRLEVGGLNFNSKYTKYSALLKALTFCDPISSTLFNRLKSKTLC